MRLRNTLRGQATTLTATKTYTPWSTPTASITPANGTGLTGQYYDYYTFSDLRYTQNDPVISFDWGSGAPAGLSTYFSIRWSGLVQPKYSETYTFCLAHEQNDTEKIIVEGQVIVNENNWQAGEACGSIALTAGTKYSITVEYSDRVGNARAVLYWSSATQTKEVIPASQLFPSSSTPTPTSTSTATATSTITPTSTPSTPSGQVWKYYYYAGSQRVAVRVTGSANPQENGLFYTLGDHLGSTSLVTDASGAEVGEMRYTPWGETRYQGGTTPTDYHYTGQREEAGIGLYYYNARWYDTKLGRFAQADTLIDSKSSGYIGINKKMSILPLTADFISNLHFLQSEQKEVNAYYNYGVWYQMSDDIKEKIPSPYGPANTIALDRYSYVRNNPLRFNDPTGNKKETENTEETPEYSYEIFDDYIMIYIDGRSYRIDITGDLFEKNKDILEAMASREGKVFAGVILVLIGAGIALGGAALAAYGYAECAVTGVTIIGLFIGLHTMAWGVIIGCVGAFFAIQGIKLINEGIQEPQGEK